MINGDTLRLLSNCISTSLVFFLGHPWKHHGHILLDSFHLLYPRKVSTFSPSSPYQVSSKLSGSIAVIICMTKIERVPSFGTFLHNHQHHDDQVCGAARTGHCPPWCCPHQDERQRAGLSQVLSGGNFVMCQIRCTKWLGTYRYLYLGS